jgi:hypothetical protein
MAAFAAGHYRAYTWENLNALPGTIGTKDGYTCPEIGWFGGVPSAAFQPGTSSSFWVYIGEIDDAVAARDTHNVIARRLPGREKRKRIWWRCPVPDCPARKRASSAPICLRHKKIVVMVPA